MLIRRVIGRMWVIPAMAALSLGLILASCGGSDDSPPAAKNETPTAGAAPVDPGSDAPSGSGNGSLTVDGQTFNFEVVFCGFSLEETGNDDVPFSFRGSGTDASGRSYSVDASIVQINVAGTSSEIHGVSFWYDDDTSDLLYDSSILGDSKFMIEGKHVGYEDEFASQDGVSFGTGVLDATCP